MSAGGENRKMKAHHTFHLGREKGKTDQIPSKNVGGCEKENHWDHRTRLMWGGKGKVKLPVGRATYKQAISEGYVGGIMNKETGGNARRGCWKRRE